MPSRPVAGWFHDGKSACVLLASGSVLLLVAAAGIEALGVLAFVPLTFAGMLLHVLGWVALNEVSKATVLMRAAFELSVIGFVAGAVAFLVIVRSAAKALVLGGWMFIPHSPFAYVPVVLAHGILFLAVPPPTSGQRSPLIVAGGLFLIGHAVATLAVLLLVPSYYGLFPRASLASLAGLSFVGYGVAAVGFRWAARARVSPLEPTVAAKSA